MQRVVRSLHVYLRIIKVGAFIVGVELIKELNEHGITVSVVDGKLKIQAKTKMIAPKLLAKIKAGKSKLLEFLSNQDSHNGGNNEGEIKRVSSTAEYLSLSYGQQSLWFMEQLDDQSAQYNMSSAFLLKGRLDRDAMQKSLDQIIQRHEVLRTIFTTRDHQPVQQVKVLKTLAIAENDLRAFASEEREAEIERLREKEAYQVFDLSADPMIRVRLLILDEHEYVVLFTLHHIASDGGSISLLISEFVILYQAFKTGQNNPLPSLEVQYGDYAHWQRNSLGEKTLEKQLAYWQSKLCGAPQLHSLPLDRVRPVQQDYRGASHTQQLDKDFCNNVKQLADNTGASLFMVLQAALALFIGRWSNETDILIGSPMSGRNRRELVPVIGYFINTLVYRTNLEGVDTFRSLIAQSRTNALEAYDNKMLPFDMLVSRLKIEPNLSYTPIHQITLTFATEESSSLELPDIVIENFDQGMDRAKVDIEITISENADGLCLHWLYATSIFDYETICCMADSFSILFNDAVANPNKDLNLLTIMDVEDQKKLQILNDSAVAYDNSHCIHEIFEQNVNKYPLNTAVIFDDAEMSYQQLNQQANQLAHYLISQGITVGCKVGICIERSANMMVAVFAVLKSGAAYVPLSPDYPTERLQFLIKDSEVKLVITQENLADKVVIPDLAIMRLNIDNSAIKNHLKSLSVESPFLTGQGLTSDNIAYIIYTSGSTGQPKGVMISHASANNYIQYAAQNYLSEESVGSVVSSPLAFDATITTLFAPLFVGKSVELLVDNDNLLEQLADYLCDDEESLLFKITPAHLDALACLMPENPSLAKHTIVIGGEQLTTNCINPWRQNLLPAAVFINEYGPTETVVGCCVHRLEPGDQIKGANIPIGKTIANTQLYVLNAGMAEQCIGAIGELYIGGAGLAQGYHNQTQMTNDRFVPSPFNEKVKLYRTGDLVKRLTNGELEFIGRVDDQVKIRGFRIELGEIETRLMDQDNVSEAVVICRQKETDIGSDNTLIAYVVAPKSMNSDSDYLAKVTAALTESLPEYMLPAAIIALDFLPLTTNGKVDKKNLPDPDFHRHSEYVEANSKIEKELSVLWMEVLNLDHISVTASFFQLGGHSLLATRLISAIREKIDGTMTVKALFENKSIRELAAVIAGQEHEVEDRISVIPRTGPLVVSFAQQRLWFIDQLDGGSSQYNMPVVMEVEGNFDVEVAEQAISRIIRRHEPLRTIFSELDGVPVQNIQNEFEFNLCRYDLSGLSEDTQKHKIEQLLSAQSSKTFDLSTDLMVRGIYIQLHTSAEKSQGVLLFNMHHIASDGWSMGILVKEFISQYQAIVNTQPDPLSPLAIQYADFAHWQNSLFAAGAIDSQLEYWRQQLADAPAVHGLGLAYPRPETKKHAGILVDAHLDHEISLKLQQLAKEHDVTPFMLIHAAVALVLSRHSNTQDIVIGTPVANRMKTELEPLIGFFVNTLVLRVNTDFEHFEDYLNHVKQVNMAAQENQNVPFEQIVDLCKVHRSAQYSPLFQIMLSMDTNEQEEIAIPGVTFRQLPEPEVAVKFDLDISAQVTQSGIEFSWCFDKSLFNREYIENLSDHLNRLLTGIAQAPSSALSDFSMLSEQEVRHLTRELNDIQTGYQQDQLIHELFEEQVEQNPENIALWFEDKQLTYRELNQLSNQLAYYLRTQGVIAETLVGICIDRSLEMVVAILAILKAGGAYVPLDPNNPKARLEYILQDTKLKHILIQPSMMTKIYFDDDVQLISLNWQSLITSYTGYGQTNLVRLAANTETHLAYILYTSGSTGQPKGVLQTHNNVSRLFLATEPDFNFDHQDVWCLFHSIAFDFSVWELWGALNFGGKLLIPSHECTRDTQAFSKLCQKQGVSILNQTPGAFNEFMQVALKQEMHFSSLRFVVFGGEALQVENLLPWWQCYGDAQPQLVNMYGITETTVHVTFKKLSPSDIGKSVIGHRLRDQAIYLLDKNHNLVPYGAVGEIFVGGAGLARGYLNQIALTNERFIPNPFNNKPDERLYRTGDLARYLPDGDLEFIGRMDDQVKIRGFRIELGEIESQLLKNNAVAACLVLAQKDIQGDKRLVAYVKPKNASLDQKKLNIELKQDLQAQLPPYMVPSVFVMVAQWPLTANGKINKKALPEPDIDLLQDSYVAPESRTEHLLTEIWGKLLHLEPSTISVTANFFEVGGHSLLAIRLINDIRSALNLKIELFTIRDIFSSELLRDLAKNIDLIVFKEKQEQIKAEVYDTDDVEEGEI